MPGYCDDADDVTDTHHDTWIKESPGEAATTATTEGIAAMVLRNVTRTRVPYIASTSLVHRNIVNSNTPSFYPHSSLSKHSDQTCLTA
jgi:hypothetical protein